MNGVCGLLLRGLCAAYHCCLTRALSVYTQSRSHYSSIYHMNRLTSSCTLKDLLLGLRLYCSTMCLVEISTTLHSQYIERVIVETANGG